MQAAGSHRPGTTSRECSTLTEIQLALCKPECSGHSSRVRLKRAVSRPVEWEECDPVVIYSEFVWVVTSDNRYISLSFRVLVYKIPAPGTMVRSQQVP